MSTLLPAEICSMCGAKRNIDSMKVHWKKYHSDVVVCSYCNVWVEDTDLVKHTAEFHPSKIRIRISSSAEYPGISFTYDYEEV